MKTPISFFSKIQDWFKHLRGNLKIWWRLKALSWFGLDFWYATKFLEWEINHDKGGNCYFYTRSGKMVYPRRYTGKQKSFRVKRKARLTSWFEC